MQKEFKLNDKVFDIRYGWGTVIDTDHITDYPILVEFKSLLKTYYTKDGKNISSCMNPTLSHEEYSINTNSNERVIEVSDYADFKEVKRRVIIKIINGKAICWSGAETIEEAKKAYSTSTWNFWREISTETIVELSFKDISEGKGKGIPPHLIRIKE